MVALSKLKRSDKLKLKWNVYLHNINKKEIVKFNIFDHWRFEEDTKKDLKKWYLLKKKAFIKTSSRFG